MECDLERKKEGGPEWRDPEGARENKKKRALAKGKKKFSKSTRGKKRGRAGNKFCAVIGGG